MVLSSRFPDRERETGYNQCWGRVGQRKHLDEMPERRRELRHDVGRCGTDAALMARLRGITGVFSGGTVYAGFWVALWKEKSELAMMGMLVTIAWATRLCVVRV